MNFFNHHMTSSPCVHLCQNRKNILYPTKLYKFCGPGGILTKFYLGSSCTLIKYPFLFLYFFLCSKSVTKWPVRFSRCILTSPQGKAGPLPTGLDIFFSRPTFNIRSSYLLIELFLEEILFCCII